MSNPQTFVSCHNCGFAIDEKRAQKIMVERLWPGAPKERYYCSQHRPICDRMQEKDRKWGSGMPGIVYLSTFEVDPKTGIPLGYMEEDADSCGAGIFLVVAGSAFVVGLPVLIYFLLT